MNAQTYYPQMSPYMAYNIHRSWLIVFNRQKRKEEKWGKGGRDKRQKDREKAKREKKRKKN